jgi:hypothetical protein
MGVAVMTGRGVRVGVSVRRTVAVAVTFGAVAVAAWATAVVGDT